MALTADGGIDMPSVGSNLGIGLRGFSGISALPDFSLSAAISALSAAFWVSSSAIFLAISSLVISCLRLLLRPVVRSSAAQDVAVSGLLWVNWNPIRSWCRYRLIRPSVAVGERRSPHLN